MKILIYGINYSPELTGVGKYSGEMAVWLSEKGSEVKVVTAPPYYPNWSVADGYSAKKYCTEHIDGVEVLRCPLFVPSEPTTVSRIIHLLSFSLTSFFGLFRHFLWRPDVVIVVEPSLFCVPGALIFSVLTRAKTVLHIQDFELDAMLGLGMVKTGLLSKMAFGVERWLMKRFDRVSTISFSMLNRVEFKGVQTDQTLFFPNWVNTSFISPQADGSIYRDKWDFSRNHKLILYSGNIGKKQGLEVVLEAAHHLNGNENIHFIIVGQGAHRSELEQIKSDKNLSNVHFKDLVPYQDLPELMAMADIHLVVQKKGAADSVLPSKLTSILSVGGHSLITAEDNTELGLLIQKYPGIAQRVEPEDVKDFVRVLLYLVEKDTKAVNSVARTYAVNELQQDAILARFNQSLHYLCGLKYTQKLKL
jgi:putative colanic acid biosynthesis glycosyltransferase WcaI